MSKVIKCNHVVLWGSTSMPPVPMCLNCHSQRSASLWAVCSSAIEVYSSDKLDKRLNMFKSMGLFNKFHTPSKAKYAICWFEKGPRRTSH